jgi:hypothetical protein
MGSGAASSAPQVRGASLVNSSKTMRPASLPSMLMSKKQRTLMVLAAAAVWVK